VRVFLGITGASGAPYAARLLETFAAADCEVGVSIDFVVARCLDQVGLEHALIPRWGE
jgi:3-polyprenyl-4-hydroxybenzoate decarboxylase